MHKDLIKLMNHPLGLNKIIQEVTRKFFYGNQAEFLCQECFSKQQNFNIGDAGIVFLHDCVSGNEILSNVFWREDNWCDRCILSQFFPTTCSYFSMSDICDKDNCLDYLLQKNLIREDESVTYF